jgi:tRNA(Ile2) C34 agmatinyltransferase TiaS
MAFRPLHAKEKLPKCRECGAVSPRVVSLGNNRHEWLCAACEYRREFPNAPRVAPVAKLSKRAPLQTETLL